MAIFGVAALVIAAMWIFQVFLLQGIYLAGKKSQFIADTNTMVGALWSKTPSPASMSLKIWR